jgi:hydrogenase 3 maturation protease
MAGLGLAVVLAGTTPERELHRLADGAFDTVLFLDAVEFSAAPGSVVLLNAGEMASRFPQVSTHKISLGLLARMIEAQGQTKVWLLGVQPDSVRRGAGLSPRVAATVGGLARLLAEVPKEALA